MPIATPAHNGNVPAQPFAEALRDGRERPKVEYAAVRSKSAEAAPAHEGAAGPTPPLTTVPRPLERDLDEHRPPKVKRP